VLQRIIGVFKLDVNTFEEIEHDSAATMQAVIIVAVVALLAGLGSLFGSMVSGTGGLGGFFGTLIWTFVGWFIWAVVTYFVGTTFFGGQASIEEMLRVLGFAYAPQLLSIIPCIGAFIGLIWSLVAGFIAVRQGLDLDNMKALITIAVGFVVIIIGNVVLGLLLGGSAALINAIGG
jgi:hypothetical protein